MKNNIVLINSNWSVKLVSNFISEVQLFRVKIGEQSYCSCKVVYDWLIVYKLFPLLKHS